MNQICQHCSYESPIGARFCRQCGAQIFVETEVSAASTRNYGRQEAAPSVAAAGSGQLPPSVAEVVAGETERYYQAPQVPTPMAPHTAPIKSGNKPWRAILLLLVLFIGLMMGVLVTRIMLPPRRNPPTPADRAQRQIEQREAEAERRREERERRLEERQRRAEDRFRETQDRAREAQERFREARERYREAVERASEAGVTFPTSGASPIDLSPYEYPGATVSASVRIPGYEMLTMRVSEGHWDAISQFYQKKLGAPVIKNDEFEEKRLIFQANALPLISVSIQTDPEHPGQLKIVVLCLPSRLPRGEEPQESQ